MVESRWKWKSLLPLGVVRWFAVLVFHVCERFVEADAEVTEMRDWCCREQHQVLGWLVVEFTSAGFAKTVMMRNTGVSAATTAGPVFSGEQLTSGRTGGFL